MVSRFFQRVREDKALWLLNGLFLILYALICFVNHANYRTYALDLGAYTRAVYDYAHFRPSYGEVFRLVPENILSDHFDLLLMLFSPLWWIFGQYTLLIVQLAAIHFGATGIYRLGRQYGLTRTGSVLGAACFLAYFGILAAVSFDYHSSVVATCFLPWFILYFRRGAYARATVFFTLMLVAKENVALWMFFVCTGLAFLHRKEEPRRRIALFFSGGAMLFFMLVVFLIMPAFSTQGQYSHIEFHILGTSFREIAVNLVSDPVRSVRLLFGNHLSAPSFNGIKAETWLFWLISGGFLFLYRPAFLWMIIPVMMQKMYHDDPAKWSVAQHYSVEFAPLLAWCLIETIHKRTDRVQHMVSSVVLLCCILVTVRLCDNTIAFVDKNRIRFYQEGHYKSDFNKQDVKAVLACVPSGAVVSAQSMFVPHLIDRKAVYQYPIVKNAGYILLSRDIHAWPLDTSTLNKRIDSLLASKTAPTVCVKGGVYLFKIQANPLY